MIERKYLAHYIDAAFDKTAAACDYVRIGRHLEEYSEELNPDIEVKKNIIGEQSVIHNGYEVEASVDPFYFESYDDALSNKLADLVNTRATGDACKTTMVDVLLKPGAEGGEPTVVWAWREDVYVVPTSMGGDTSGVGIPFTVYKAGGRVKGSFDTASRKFTPGE